MNLQLKGGEKLAYRVFMARTKAADWTVYQSAVDGSVLRKGGKPVPITERTYYKALGDQPSNASAWCGKGDEEPEWRAVRSLWEDEHFRCLVCT